MARFRGGGQEKSIAKQLMKDINKAIASSIQQSAVTITNGLVEAGPAWTGEFAASWDAVPAGEAGRPPREANGRLYSYTRRNFPASRFEKAIEKGKLEFEIVNTSPHAAQAIDESRDIFKRPESDPIKDPVLGDNRDNPSLRYEIGRPFSGELADAPAARTAEPDWFYTYVQGGALQVNLGRGVELGFKYNYAG